MAKLIFRYGAMGASKTANALMVRYNYEEKGKTAIMIKPDIEDRDGEYVIKSRIGLEAQCFPISWLKDYILKLKREFPFETHVGGWKDIIGHGIDCIICDESQFFTEDDIDLLTSLVDEVGIPVICYGLRTDFRGKLFTASAKLLAEADVIEEIPTICWCGRKAHFNARVVDGEIVKDGEQMVLGSNDLYVGLCRKHFKEGRIKR